MTNSTSEAAMKVPWLLFPTGDTGGYWLCGWDMVEVVEPLVDFLPLAPRPYSFSSDPGRSFNYQYIHISLLIDLKAPCGLCMPQQSLSLFPNIKCGLSFHSCFLSIIIPH